LTDPLRTLIELPLEEKKERGLEHTPQEIFQQPATWANTFARCRDLNAGIREAVRRAGVRSSATPTVYLVGAGTSDYSARAVAPLLRRTWACDAYAVASTTLLTDFDDFHLSGRRYFWISFSRSGDSPEGVALLERTLEQHPQIHHLLITCNSQGKMAQLCLRHPDRALPIVLDDAVNDRGLAMTSSFTNMLLAAQCAAHVDEMDRFGESVRQMSETGAQFLAAAAQVADAVTALNCTRACFVGSGALSAVATESSLKVVELTSGKITTLSETPLGLRHGPLSSVDSQTIFGAYLSSEPQRRGYELDLLREIERKRLGKVRIAVTVQGNDDILPLVDYCLSLDCPKSFPDNYRPVLDVMLGQLLGLFASIRCGLKPDQPSPNGAINRVVSPIKLYS
jgi:tagatose-6-phosphate ketose/aldose isomerase